MKKTDKLDNEFKIFKESALRICALPFYDCGETEEVKKYMEGYPIDPNNNNEWLRDIKKWSAEGKKIIRIIVLPTIENDYNKWIMRVIEANAVAGEEIVFISEKEYIKLLDGKESSDYWIFDNERIAKMYYDDKNDYTHCEIITDNLENYIDLFDILYKKSIPLTDVLKKIRENFKIIL